MIRYLSEIRPETIESSLVDTHAKRPLKTASVYGGFPAFRRPANIRAPARLPPSEVEFEFLVGPPNYAEQPVFPRTQPADDTRAPGNVSRHPLDLLLGFGLAGLSGDGYFLAGFRFGRFNIVLFAVLLFGTSNRLQHFFSVWNCLHM